MRLQTIKGKIAKAPTAEEIKDILTTIWEKVKNHPNWPEGLGPCWSLDNAHVHKSALASWDHRNSWRHQRDIPGYVEKLPPYSPDIHQVVEHAIGNMVTRYRQKLMDYICSTDAVYRSKLPMDVPGHFQLLEECFMAANAGNTIADNVAKLMDQVVDVIIRGEGMYPPKKYT